MSATARQLFPGGNRRQSQARAVITRAVEHRKMLDAGEVDAVSALLVRAQRKDAMSRATIELIRRHWHSPEVSRMVPDKKAALSVYTGKVDANGKRVYTRHPRYILECSQTMAYANFKQQYPHITCAQRRYEELRPFDVKRNNPAHRISCCCRWHVEGEDAFYALWHLARRVKRDDDNNTTPCCLETVVDSGGVLNRFLKHTMCDKGDAAWHDLACYRGECERCGVGAGEEGWEAMRVSGLRQSYTHYVYEPTGKRDKNGREMQRLAMRKVQAAPAVDVVEHFLKSIYSGTPFQGGLVFHAFENRFINHVCQSSIDTFPPGVIHLTTDFAENITLDFERGAQSLHWCPEEVSLYNVTLLRHAEPGVDDELIAAHDSGTRIVIKEYHHFLLEDTVHDQEAVHQCHHLLTELLETRDITQSGWWWWSDGCKEHFKSAGAFADCAQYPVLFRVDLMRFFTKPLGPEVFAKLRKMLLKQKRIVG